MSGDYWDGFDKWLAEQRTGILDEWRVDPAITDRMLLAREIRIKVELYGNCAITPEQQAILRGDA